MIHGFNSDTKEKVEVVKGKIVTYARQATVPASTNSYNASFDITNEPEASQYDHFMILGYEFIYHDGTRFLSPKYTTPDTNHPVPNLTLTSANHVICEMFNFSTSDQVEKFQVRVLWYND